MTYASPPRETSVIADRFHRALASLRAVAVAGDGSRPVPATPGWSVSDVVAHLAIESDRYARELEGRGTWSPSAAEIAETNRRELEDFGERDLDRLHATIATNVERYVGRLRELDLDEPMHGLDAGVVVAPKHGAGVLLGELVVHGHDIAAATGRVRPIPRDDAVFIIDGVWRLLPGWVDRRRATFRGGFELRLRGHHSLTLRIDDGVAEVDVAVTRPGTVISADPAAFLLMMYGRRTQLQTLVRLQAIAWGRRPDRALTLRRLFAQP